MSNFSSSLKSSLSGIISNDLMHRLEDNAIFSEALSDKNLVTIQGKKDAENLNYHELTEIKQQLEKLLANPNADGYDDIQTTLVEIEKYIQSLPAPEPRPESRQDISSLSNHDALTELLEQGDIDVVSKAFADFSPDLQRSILEYYYHQNDYDSIRMLFEQAEIPDMALLIAEIAAYDDD